MGQQAAQQQQQQQLPQQQALAQASMAMATSMASMAGQPMSMAQAVMAGAGQGIMVQGDRGQLLQQQLLMAQRPGIAPGMMLGQGMQLGGMPGIPGMQVGLPGAMGGLVSSQPQLFARSPRAASCARRWRTDGHGPALAGSPAADAGAA